MPNNDIQPRQPVVAFGSVEGQVQPPGSSGPLWFTLIDSIYNHAITCCVQDGQEELMRDMGDRRVIVEGWVSRDPTSGRPVAVRHIENVILLGNVVPGSYRRARGISPADANATLPEQTISRLRE